VLGSVQQREKRVRFEKEINGFPFLWHFDSRLFCFQSSSKLEGIMTRTEIERYLNVGKTRGVCVDRTLESQLPGYIRQVSIHRPARVSIEFEPYGHEEGGIGFTARFDVLEQAISFPESYLGRSIEAWENFTATGNYPENPQTTLTVSTWEDVQRIAATLVPPEFTQSSPAQ
jgi:hypothetical protein